MGLLETELLIVMISILLVIGDSLEYRKEKEKERKGNKRECNLNDFNYQKWICYPHSKGFIQRIFSTHLNWMSVIEANISMAFGLLGHLKVLSLTLI